MRKLGASRVFDDHDAKVVPAVIDALAGKTIAGALAIGAGSPEACVDVVRACKGNKFVSLATFPVSFDQPLGHKVPMLSSALDLQRKGVSARKIVVSLPSGSVP